MQIDDELIDEIRHGSKSAMEVLIKRHYKTVFSYIYRNVGDFHISYDLSQETFIKMARNIHSYSAGGKFQYWLLKIALNTCRDYYKSRANKSKNNSVPLDETLIESKSKVIDLIEQKLE